MVMRCALRGVRREMGGALYLDLMHGRLSQKTAGTANAILYGIARRWKRSFWSGAWQISRSAWAVGALSSDRFATRPSVALPALSGLMEHRVHLRAE
jgi:hypothetical protein